ncbi:DeoR family transcriptional regulator [Candidatus Nomurabacteria bacterium]|nr:DeoR family transcriptional regulator [Candidatus Nomurabacteria bacterium]
MDSQKDNQRDRLKLEKLASAVYLITDFLNDSDPLKWRLRDKALSLLDQVVLSHINQILSLINIVRLNPNASEMNLNILKREYDYFKDRLVSEKELSFEQETLISGAKLSPKLHAGNSDRRDTIFKIIKQNGPISIADIARAVPDVSSKTVQRELAELVRSGALKKEGERRWSRYLTV